MTNEGRLNGLTEKWAFPVLAHFLFRLTQHYVGLVSLPGPKMFARLFAETLRTTTI